MLGVKVAAGEGMPIYRNPFEKGNLVITFEVEYPAAEWFSIAENREALAKLLPPKQDQGKVFEIGLSNLARNPYLKHYF